MASELLSRLKTLKIEEFIWLVYIGIIVLSVYSNEIERKFLIYKDKESKEKYRRLNLFIFIIAVIVYIYFFLSSYNDYKNSLNSNNEDKKKYNGLSFVASTLILISGIIFIYIIVSDENVDTEIAFS